MTVEAAFYEDLEITPDGKFIFAGLRDTARILTGSPVTECEKTARPSCSG